MPVLPNEEIEAKLRDQGLSVHIAYRQMRALESIAEIMNAARVGSGCLDLRQLSGTLRPCTPDEDGDANPL